MEDVEFADVTVKRCTACFGLWFDHSKHEYLKDVDGASAIDLGDPAIGARYNERGPVFCPDCQAPMIGMVVAEQPHLWYESCSKCFSVFFDAGEFRDYTHKRIVDYFKDLFAKERH